MTRFIAIALAFAACNSRQAPTAATSPTTELDLVDVPDGLSGLAVDPLGELWAIAERDHRIVRIDLIGRRDEHVVRLHGVPAGFELESLAFLPNGDIVVGTETDAVGRSDDALLFARVGSDSSLNVDGKMSVPYGLWGIKAPANQGIEAICVAGDSLVLVVEPIIELDGTRLAPLAVYDLSQATWRSAHLELTSDTGKISGLSCRPSAMGVEFIAIERHFPVRRVLRGVIGNDARTSRIVPRIELDLSTRTENLEGIAWLTPESIVLVSDNSTGGKRSGAAKLLFARLAD